MVKTPNNTNHAQLALYNQGMKRLRRNPDIANTAEPHQIRREGVKRIGEIAAVGLLSAGLGGIFVNALDRSDTYGEHRNAPAVADISGNTSDSHRITVDMPNEAGQHVPVTLERSDR